MKCHDQQIRVHRDGTTCWVSLAVWLADCPADTLLPLRPREGLCHVFRVREAEDIRPNLSDGAARAYVEQGLAVMYRSVENGIELWLPVGIPVGWTVNVNALRDDTLSTPWVVDYTNHRGERRTRRLIPGRTYQGSTKWHPETQWLMDALDLDKNDVRTFALKDFHGSPRTEDERFPTKWEKQTAKRVMEVVACPRCKAPAGTHCRPGGTLAALHAERGEALRELPHPVPMYPDKEA